MPVHYGSRELNFVTIRFFCNNFLFNWIQISINFHQFPAGHPNSASSRLRLLLQTLQHKHKWQWGRTRCDRVLWRRRFLGFPVWKHSVLFIFNFFYTISQRATRTPGWTSRPRSTAPSFSFAGTTATPSPLRPPTSMPATGSPARASATAWTRWLC